jgi:hypothetical protein
VDAFQRALQGDDGALRRCLGDHAQYVARALVGVLGGSDLSAVEAAARTLGWVGTMTEVPELRRIRASTGWDRTREACKAAIAELTSKASLPRPAEPAREDADTLPRVAGPHRPDAGRLPRPAGADTTEFAPGEPTDD